MARGGQSVAHESDHVTVPKRLASVDISVTVGTIKIFIYLSCHSINVSRVTPNLPGTRLVYLIQRCAVPHPTA